MTRTKARPATVRLAVGTYNTRLGWALEDGALTWLMIRCPRVSIWVLSEVPSIDALRRALRRTGQARRWRIVPAFGGRRGLTYVLVRRRRYDVVKVKARRTSFGSRHNRRALTVTLDDRRSGRHVIVGAFHPDPLGLGFEGASRGARNLHVAQVQASVDDLADAAADVIARGDTEPVLIAAGDFNERLGEPVQQRTAAGRLADKTASAQLRRIGLDPSYATTPRGDRHVHLDDVFTKRVDVRRRRVLTPPGRGDHPAVVTSGHVQAAA